MLLRLGGRRRRRCVATEWVARRRLPSAMGRARTQFLVINQGGHPVYHDDTNPSAWEAATQASTQSPRETPPPSPRAAGTLSASP